METAMKGFTSLLVLVLSLTAFAQNTPTNKEIFDHYTYRKAAFPLTTAPQKWAHQPDVDTWDTMEQAAASAHANGDGYGLYQLAYLEYVNQYTRQKLEPKTMLYHAFEIGKEYGDPYLMYWVTALEEATFYDFEYMDRRRNHARWTDSVATERQEWPVLLLLADLNDACFQKIKRMANESARYANLKNETFGLIKYDIRKKADEMKKSSLKKTI